MSGDTLALGGGGGSKRSINTRVGEKSFVIDTRLTTLNRGMVARIQTEADASSYGLTI